jgi:L-asparaginase
MQTRRSGVLALVGAMALSAAPLLFADQASTGQAASGQATAGQQATPPEAPLPKVFLFATGGTISNRVGGRMTVDELIVSIPGLDRRVRAEGEQFANVSSSSMSLDQWLDLSRRINARFKADPELAGVVVTSGTDTLEELAYFLHLTVRDERPVVVVGSMRNPSTLGYEGAANLEDAFRAAADPMSRGMGAVVVLNDEINSAREVTKTDSFNLNTFQSRAFGILGVVDPSGVAYYRKPTRRHSAQSEFDVTTITALPRVDVVTTYQGATGDVINALVDAGAKGLVLATAGAGALAGNQSEGTRYARDKGVWMVRTTRAGTGRIPPPGPGRGGTNFSVAGDNLTPIKARILLMLALATTSDGVEIQRMFREY